MNTRNELRIRPDVQLTPLLTDHADLTYRWLCDPVVSRELGLRRVPSPESTIEWIANTVLDAEIRAFAVLFDGEHVGNTMLDRYDSYLASARLSVYLGEAHSRGRGVGASAVYLTLRDGFDNWALNKIRLTVHCQNQRAIRTYHRLGFVTEGKLRQEFWLAGQRADAYYMGCLQEDFRRLSVGCSATT